MFTWICPRCGREVPPSSNECPDCAARSEGATPEARPKPKFEATEAPEPTGKPAPATTSRAKGTGAPSGWFLTFVFAIVFVSMGALGFAAYRYFSNRAEPLPENPVNPIRTPTTAGPDSATLTANVLNKYIEVTGIRLNEDNPKNLQVQFVIVNHSSAPLIDVTGSVAIRPTTSKPEGEAVGTFDFRIPELRPYESKDMKAPLHSKLRVYELPDWQFIRADVTITSPQPNQ